MGIALAEPPVKIKKVKKHSQTFSFYLDATKKEAELKKQGYKTKLEKKTFQEYVLTFWKA